MSNCSEFLWKKNLRQVTPYVPGDQPKFSDMIKLNTNENPYPPAPEVREILASMDAGGLRRYPSVDGGVLREEIAHFYNVRKEEVFVGVGSDDVLGMAFLTFFNGDKGILFPDVTYSFYDVWAELFKIDYEKKPLKDDLTIDIHDYLNTDADGIVIANPNAPTSIALATESLEEIVRSNPQAVVICDEAYVDFGAEYMLKNIHKYDNLLVVQTFSKSRSMAGMRIGFAIGNEALIKAMYDVRNSYNSYTMTTVSILCGAAAVRDRAYFEKTVSMIMATRERSRKALETLGFTVLDSKTNFLFASHKSVPAVEIYEKLKEKHIFVRYFKKPERISNYLRITVGTDEEMNRLIAELTEICS